MAAFVTDKGIFSPVNSSKAEQLGEREESRRKKASENKNNRIIMETEEWNQSRSLSRVHGSIKWNKKGWRTDDSLKSVDHLSALPSLPLANWTCDNNNNPDKWQSWWFRVSSKVPVRWYLVHECSMESQVARSVAVEPAHGDFSYATNQMISVNPPLYAFQKGFRGKARSRLSTLGCMF